MEVFTQKARLDLVEALGLDPKSIQSINIQLDGQQTPTVTIVKYITDDQMKVLGQMLQGFELVEKWAIPLEQ
jgi:hypothetical protein